MNLAVIGELPLVIVNVQRGGPSTGLPTKSEQTDLLQALRTQRRKPDAYNRRNIADQLFRRRLYGMQDCLGTHDSGCIAD